MIQTLVLISSEVLVESKMLLSLRRLLGERTTMIVIFILFHSSIMKMATTT